MRRSDCPEPQDLIDFCVGKLSDEKIDGIAAHLNHCEQCEKLVQDIEKVPIPFIAYHLAETTRKSKGFVLDPGFLQRLDELKRLNPGSAN